MAHYLVVDQAGRPKYWKPARRALQEATARALEGMVAAIDGGRQPDVSSMVDLLEKIMAWSVDAEGATLSRFLDQLIYGVANLGSYGDDFNNQRFLDVLDRSIALFSEAGLPVWPIHLAKASFLATRENGGRLRRRAFEAAVECSSTSFDCVYTSTMLALYEIDVSRYDQARAILDACMRTCLQESTCTRLLPEIHADYGILQYSRGRTASARRHFEAALATGVDPTDPYAIRPIAKAYHFMGRILNSLGDRQLALEHLVRGQQHKEMNGLEERRQSAYYHLRLGEVLAAGGTFTEADYHLAESQRYLQQIHEDSTAQATLDSVVADLNRRLGRLAEAEALLAEALAAARRSNYPRGALLFSARLARLALKQGQWTTAARHGTVAAHLWVRGENKGNVIRALLRAVAAVNAHLLLGLRRLGRRRTLSMAAIFCPCGGDHVWHQKAGKSASSSMRPPSIVNQGMPI